MPPAPPQRDENPFFAFINLRHLRLSASHFLIFKGNPALLSLLPCFSLCPLRLCGSFLVLKGFSLAFTLIFLCALCALCGEFFFVF